MTTAHTYEQSEQSTQTPFVLPTSSAQQRLWFLNQLEPESAAYSMPSCLYLNIALDIEALQRSLAALIERHEALRTTFVALDGNPMQVINAPFSPQLPLIDLSALPATAQNERANQLANQEAQKPFDLSRGPLLRGTLLKLGDAAYILLLTLHHIIYDEWSMHIFYQELAALYSAFAAGQSAPLTDLPLQYADFAVWQQQIREQMLVEHLPYWRYQLANLPASLDLPSDHARPLLQTSHGASYFMDIPPSLLERLAALSQQQGVTLYMTLAAAFQTLLYRYTNQDDMVIGTVTSGRTLAEIEPMIGFFANTVVLRSNLAGNPTFRALLGRVREVVLEAYAHQDAPFESLVRELHPDRSPGRNPLFQVMLTLLPPLPTLPPGWKVSHRDIQTGAARFDLALDIEESEGGLLCQFEYSTEMFEAATITRMAGHWQTLLEGIVSDPDQPLADLPILAQSERAQLLRQWNDTHSPYPTDMTVHQLFERQVEQTPEAIAAVFEDQQVTYRQLNAGANQLAHHLQRLGVGEETLVGICVERSLDMLIGLLGILKAGGTYVPLDPTYPAERLAFMLEDAQVSVLVTQSRLDLPSRLPAQIPEVVFLDTDKAQFDAQSTENLPPISRADNLAYVIYTSGSTGKPKGVQIPHRAIVNFLLSMQQAPGLSADDTLLAVTTLSFDIAGLELYLPLISGARVVIASQDTVTNGAALAELMARTRATVMQATPITWRMLLASGWQGKPDLKILCGGESLPLELARQLLPKAASLWNMYGPTETTIWSTTCRIEAEDEVVTIGRPIANTEIYILDDHLRPIPIGVPGELYIGGDGLARGYLRRPALTAERFIAHPFNNSRLYKTGDLARYRADGAIEVLGRLDHQVKIRGFRIELGEIEAVLAQHPNVRQAVVVAREDSPGDTRLVAYIVPYAGQHVAREDIQQLVARQVPSYMMPSAFVELDVLPQTPNGKVDRRALPQPDYGQRAREQAFSAPGNSLQAEVASCWSQVLGIEQIGIHDNFFSLGGHSLLAMQIASRLRTKLQVEVPLRSFFEAPTVAQLSEAITHIQAQENKLKFVGPRPVSREAYRVRVP
jgi:amino acid adenylation domain-containing protein